MCVWVVVVVVCVWVVVVVVVCVCVWGGGACSFGRNIVILQLFNVLYIIDIRSDQKRNA